MHDNIIIKLLDRFCYDMYIFVGLDFYKYIHPIYNDHIKFYNDENKIIVKNYDTGHGMNIEVKYLNRDDYVIALTDRSNEFTFYSVYDEKLLSINIDIRYIYDNNNNIVFSTYEEDEFVLTFHDYYTSEMIYSIELSYSYDINFIKNVILDHHPPPNLDQKTIETMKHKEAKEGYSISSFNERNEKIRMKTGLLGLLMLYDTNLNLDYITPISSRNMEDKIFDWLEENNIEYDKFGNILNEDDTISFHLKFC